MFGVASTPHFLNVQELKEHRKWRDFLFLSAIINFHIIRNIDCWASSIFFFITFLSWLLYTDDNFHVRGSLPVSPVNHFNKRNFKSRLNLPNLNKVCEWVSVAWDNLVGVDSGLYTHFVSFKILHLGNYESLNTGAKFSKLSKMFCSKIWCLP